MKTIIILNLISIVLLLPAIIVCCYYNFLAIVSLIPEKKKKCSFNGYNLNFIIVIPAHNEELIIQSTLDSCAQIDYPEDKYEVIVIADNCTDSTKEVVAKTGFTCLQRNNKNELGKGFALKWFFNNLEEREYDAVVVLDADCVIDADALKVFSHYFAEGYDALQANDISSNPDASPISYVVSVGNFIENNFFYAPKSKIGLAVFLRGTGFALKKSVLDTYPWDAHSIVEDMEYSLNLIKGGMKIKFIQDIKVASEFPFDKNQFNVQRKRWSSNLGYGKIHGIKLLFDGIVKKKLLLADAGLTILTLSRPLVLFELFIALTICTIAYLLSFQIISKWLMIIAIGTTVVQCCYFGSGILSMGINIKRSKYLLKTPAILLRLIFVSFIGLLGIDKETWKKTPR